MGQRTSRAYDAPLTDSLRKITLDFDGRKTTLGPGGYAVIPGGTVFSL